MRTVEIEDHLGATEHLAETRLLVRRSLRPRARVVRDVAGPRHEVGIVEELDPRIDRADPLEMLGLEWRCDEHHERLGHQVPGTPESSARTRPVTQS